MAQKRLPTEIWLIIIDILGLQGYTRDCTNLVKYLELSETLVYKYLVTELHKTRGILTDYDISKPYDEQMIAFWKRTGIDDGVPIEYLVSHLNSDTKMYKTIWAYSVFTNKNGKYKAFGSCLFDYLRSGNNHKFEFTDCIFKDERQSVTGKMYWGDLSKESKIKIDSISCSSSFVLNSNVRMSFSSVLKNKGPVLTK